MTLKKEYVCNSFKRFGFKAFENRNYNFARISYIEYVQEYS